MADLVWPPGLPQSHKTASTFKRASGKLNSDTGAGTFRTRRLFTSAAYRYSDRLVFTTAQLAIFDEFYVTTLDEGTLRFEWKDPRNGNTVDQIILEYPEFRDIGAGYWEGIAQFEVVP